MIIYEEFDFYNFEPWSGAIDTYDRICNEGKEAEFEQILDELYPNGMSKTDLNDLLWFEPEAVYEWLGISDENDEDDLDSEDEKKLTDPNDYEKFDDFCDDCERCPYGELPGDINECEARFYGNKYSAC